MVEAIVKILVILEGVGAELAIKGPTLAALDFKEVLAGCAQPVV